VAGQCCVATERLFVQESVKDEFLSLLLAAAAEPVLGDPMADDTSYGPVNNETVAARMDAHVAEPSLPAPPSSPAAPGPAGLPATSTGPSPSSTA
jgi:succinate-semialdehyde dehydrogenase/glutarate-semialdehyde dehydrogenase